MIVLIVYSLPIKRIIQRRLRLLNHLGTKGKHVLIDVGIDKFCCGGRINVIIIPLVEFPFAYHSINDNLFSS